MSAPQRFLVIIDGAGEFDDDYNVHTATATSPQVAVDKAVEDGYGKARAFVVRLEDVIPFALGEHRTTVADPVTFDEVVAALPVGMRQYLEADDPRHKTEAESRRPRVPPRRTPLD